MAATYQNKPSTDFLSYYLSVNVNNVCRICLERNTKLMPIFDPVKPPHFPVLIMACASVQVTEGDGLPPYICPKCISKLNIAYQFKTQCEYADAKLRQCFTQDKLTTTTQRTGDDDNENGFCLVDGATTQLHSLENVPLDEQTSATVVPPSPTNLNDLDRVNLNEFKLELVEELRSSNGSGGGGGGSDLDIKVEDLIGGLTGLANDGTSKKTSSIVGKRYQCDTCGKIFRTKPSLIHHIRIHTGERPYVCHLCEKRFINGGHLHTHMRTHTGEKNHVCAACGKAFATAQQLTKHTIAIHTSERPYACAYCPKRFASSSNLATHTKIHTGEKNYHCDQCGKAFSTKGQLFQHMLVHTGEKAFLCEYCNKRFSQKAHLIRHLKTHKQQQQQS